MRTQRTQARRSRGFTLIELMLVVGIIGLLSSLAIPEFTRLTMRARAAERHEIMLRIKKAVADVYVQQGHIPGGVLVGGYQPALPALSTKRVPDWKAPGWVAIFQTTDEIEGSTYYSYSFRADDTASPPTLEIWALGDLDGDSVPSVRWVKYERKNGAYVTDENDTTGTWVSPAAGLEDSVSF